MGNPKVEVEGSVSWYKCYGRNDLYGVCIRPSYRNEVGGFRKISYTPYLLSFDVYGKTVCEASLLD